MPSVCVSEQTFIKLDLINFLKIKTILIIVLSYLFVVLWVYFSVLMPSKEQEIWDKRGIKNYYYY